jgi:hypothetical protein
MGEVMGMENTTMAVDGNMDTEDITGAVTLVKEILEVAAWAEEDEVTCDKTEKRNYE